MKPHSDVTVTRRQTWSQIPCRIHDCILLPFAWSSWGKCRGWSGIGNWGKYGSNPGPRVPNGQVRDDRRTLQEILCAIVGGSHRGLSDSSQLRYSIIRGLPWRYRKQVLPKRLQLFTGWYQIFKNYVVKIVLNIYQSNFRVLTELTARAQIVLIPCRTGRIDPEDGVSAFFWNSGLRLQDPTLLKPGHTKHFKVVLFRTLCNTHQYDTVHLLVLINVKHLPIIRTGWTYLCRHAKHTKFDTVQYG
jgi:hypothetical protein